MQKDNLIVLIRALHREMQALTIKAGVNEEKYINVLQILEGTEQEIMELLSWLEGVRFNQYEEVLKIWERHIPETWEMYQIMQVTQLREQILLRAAFQKLTKVWR